MRNLAVCISVEYFESFKLLQVPKSKLKMQLRSNFYNNQILFIFGVDVCLLEMLQIGKDFSMNFRESQMKILRNMGTPNAKNTILKYLLLVQLIKIL